MSHGTTPRRHRSLWRLLALLAALAMLAAACGGDDGDDGDASGGGGGGGDGQFSGETIEVAAVWSGAEQEAFEKVLDSFEEQTGATVEFTSTGDDIATVIGNRLEGGDPPDVAVLPQPGLMSDLVGRDALQPIEEIAGEWGFANRGHFATRYRKAYGERPSETRRSR